MNEKLNYPDCEATDAGQHHPALGGPLLARVGDWKITSEEQEVTLWRMAHECQHGLPQFPVEELFALRACVEQAIHVALSDRNNASGQSVE